MGFLERSFGATRVVFTDRHGGTSPAPYDTANLGLLTEDDPGRVRDNRQRVGAAIGGAAEDPDRWFRMRQVHGSDVVVAGSPSPAVPDADAAVTAEVAQPLVVLTADCVPVALVSEHAIGAVHAGWRGLTRGVIEAAVAGLRALDDTPVRAVLGPCIHAERYAFGAAELETVASSLGPTVRARTADGLPALDLRAGARAALTAVDVTDVTEIDVCTAASADYFSHRRDGVTGRQAMIVVRDP